MGHHKGSIPSFSSSLLPHRATPATMLSEFLRPRHKRARLSKYALGLAPLPPLPQA